VTKRREAVGEAPVPQPGRAPATPSRSSGRVAFSAPSAEAGWLALSGDGGSDGGIVDATAVRIRFAAP
jgi:hypothetical protein